MSELQRRELGSTGIVVSVLGLGCNNFGGRVEAEASRRVIESALDLGVTFFDTAESYAGGESERVLGRTLAGRRDGVVLASKFGWWREPFDGEARGAPLAVRRALEGSLKRLGTDYIDLYQYHRPDGVTPVAETLGVLDELVGEGKIRAVGSSNMSGQELAAADEVARRHGLKRFVTAQNEYSWLEREAEVELIPTCRRLGVALLPYFPLASGLLTGKYRREADWPEGTRLPSGSRRLDGAPMSAGVWGRLSALESLAARDGATMLQLAIGGLAALPFIGSVIAGATQPAQVQANVAAAAWRPSASALAELGYGAD